MSIDAQRRALHELAAARGYIVVGEYADAVESGKDDDRPAFQAMLARCTSLRETGPPCWRSIPRGSPGAA